MIIESRRQALVMARRLFSEQGAVPSGMVAEPILRSWRRCADLGHEMRGARRQEPLTQSELTALRCRHERLRRLCEPTLTMLRREARRSGSLIILADGHGMVLDSVGATDFADRASRVALMPGAPWDEGAAGTNAIGTALVEGRPIVVQGAEHFFAPNRILTCTAVPIVGPFGRVQAVLDLSGDAGHDHRHAMGMVALAAAQIERKLFVSEFSDCTLLCLHANPALLDTPQEGVLALREGVVVGANRQARALLALEDVALGVYRCDDLFDAGLDSYNKASVLRSHAGMLFHVTLRPPMPAASPAGVAPTSDRVRVRAGRPPRPAYDAALLTELARAVHLCDAGVSILLQGETGVGKEVFARELHARSRRAHRPFIAVNCAALPESLIESELFGYEEGAFTGARKQGSKGLLRQAHGGMLFLDEIGDMPPNLQARLLRVLQEREVMPLGGGHAVPVDFALVCATHRCLSPEAPNVAMRADLFFRIAEYTVRLDPLRVRTDKREVVRALWAAQDNTSPLPAEMEEALVAYDWPGNYRQLVALLRTLCVLGQVSGGLRMEMLPPEIRWPMVRRDHEDGRAAAPALREINALTTDGSESDGVMTQAPSLDGEIRLHGDGPLHLRDLSLLLMQKTLAACEGNISRAARELGVHRSTLYRRIAAAGRKLDA